MRIVKGNLFNFPFHAIFHQCNCFHTMGAGFAKILVNKYPEILIEDKKTPYGDINKLGSYSRAIISSETGFSARLIYNLYSQYHYGKGSLKTDYNALKTSFQKACEDLLDYKQFICYENEKIQLSIPYLIGCGLAGGDENIVIDIIDYIMIDYPDIELTAYKIN